MEKSGDVVAFCEEIDDLFYGQPLPILVAGDVGDDFFVEFDELMVAMAAHHGQDEGSLDCLFFFLL